MIRRLIVTVLTIVSVSLYINAASNQYAHADAHIPTVRSMITAGGFHLSYSPPNNIRSVYPSDIKPKSRLKPNDTASCFNIGITVKRTGTNTYSVYGNLNFFCGTMYGGYIEVSNIQNCPVVGSVPSSTYKDFPKQITSTTIWTYVQSFTAYCEGCINHIPNVFPFFTIDTSIYATTYTAVAGKPVSDPASYTNQVEGYSRNVNTGFPNSPFYTLPC